MLGDLSWWEAITTFFDAIPKLIYLLYACVASAVDAMQLLVRRLCGLDLYINNAGEVVRDQDPLTEFINGILGIGDTSGAMQALNTTFWSLTIFALILLSLTTIVAIIKSHYNEDVGKTSPAKILYGAFKSILTFFIVPAAVVIGLQLSSLLLRTLDDITAGTTDSATIEGIYGSGNRQRFAPYTSGYEGDTFSSYGGYDMFGIGQPATNSPISGQLFRAAAYNANRFRTGGYTLDNINGDGPSYEAAADKLEYVAYQVDYAFINNLQLSSPYDYNTLKENANNSDGARIAHLEFAFDRSLDSFSKYDVAFVWVYYDLWNFNFIVGFAGAISAFGIMISIIIGLMMRLIKSAAMFLIYPPLLGLAPMDDFKAFKSWSNEFIKQILSAFGAIVGLNLLFLILPYVQQISFFDIGLLDAIVNCVFLITGLIMAKDFISMVAGFVGGGDVFSTGDGAKGQVAKTMGTGIKAAVGAGAAVTAAGLLPGAMVARGVKTGIAAARLKFGKHSNANLEKQKEDLVDKKAELQLAEDDEKAAREHAENNWVSMHMADIDTAKKDPHLKKTFDDVHDEVYKKAIKDGKSRFDALREADEAAYKAADKELESRDKTWRKNKKTAIEGDTALQAASSKKILLADEVQDMQEKYDKSAAKQTKIAQNNYLNKDGSASGKGAVAFLQNSFAQGLGPLKLFAKDVSANLNVDKLAGQFKTLTRQVRGKDAQGNDAIKSTAFTPDDKSARKQQKEYFEQIATAKGYAKGSADYKNEVKRGMRHKDWENAKEIGKAIGQVVKEILSPVLIGTNKASGETKYTGDKLQAQQYKATQAQTKATEAQSKKIDELIKTMESFVKKAGGGTP